MHCKHANTCFGSGIIHNIIFLRRRNQYVDVFKNLAQRNEDEISTNLIQKGGVDERKLPFLQ